MLATLDQAAEIEAAVRLVCARLCSAAWPRSAIAAEAKAAGVSEAAVNAALLAVGAVTVGGRLTLRANGHALESPIEEPAAAKDERAALVKARRLLREQLKEGPKPRPRSQFDSQSMAGAPGWSRPPSGSACAPSAGSGGCREAPPFLVGWW
jgi:hypothetical protein